jgi:regulator of protease activity HflC (stomatin/prohibitin superfamily)
MSQENKNVAKLFGLATLLLLGLIIIFMAGPQYNVYVKEQKGKATLSEAENSRKAQIEEAKANLESEKLNARAEVERAKGAAKAIKIEGGKLTNEYIKYLWIRQQKPGVGNTQTIYIPTEAGLPILEAGAGRP